MALDEVLLHFVTSPVLRVYRWSGPWVSFGYSQSLAQVSHQRPGQSLVRRWTGGGIVDHDGDWTFSLIVPRSVPFARRRPAESYCAVHEAVSQALADTGISSALAPTSSPTPAEACFRGQPAQFDVLATSGLKMCGGAQRRNHSGILHQGSLRHPELPPDFLLHFSARLSGDSTVFDLPHSVQVAASLLAEERYRSLAWTARIA